MSEMTQVLGTVAMEPKGEWDSSAYYEKLNTVLYNDSTYMAKEGVVGENPSTSSKWQLIGGGITKEYVASKIVDNLDSSDATKMLSAKQGKVLDGKKPTIYENVASMKTDTNLKEGMTVQTLGYYEINDGGAATYKITDEESETDYQEELESGLYATLVVKNYVTPEMFGCYGDDTHDDKNALQKMFDYPLNNIVMNKTYYVSNSVIVKGNNYKINGTASIRSDSNNPVLILNVTYSEINLTGTIEGATCIKFRATEADDTWVQYVTLKNMILNATDKCVECERTSGKWINEISFDKVNFNGVYGFYFMGDYSNSGYRFINCGNEVCTTAFIKAYNLSYITIVGLRNAESWRNVLINIENNCDFFSIDTSDPINIENLVFTRSVVVRGEINANIYDNGGSRIGSSARCFNGVFFLNPESTNGLRLNATNDTYDYTTNESTLFRTCLTLDYVEGGHNYAIKLPNGYCSTTEKLLTIRNSGAANTLTLYSGTTAHNISFSSSGLFEIINHSGVLYLSKFDGSTIS